MGTLAVSPCAALLDALGRVLASAFLEDLLLCNCDTSDFKSVQVHKYCVGDLRCSVEYKRSFLNQMGRAIMICDNIIFTTIYIDMTLWVCSLIYDKTVRVILETKWRSWSTWSWSWSG